MIEPVSTWALRHEGFLRYLSISVFIAVLDFALSWISERFTGVVIANTIGVVGGFIVQYLLTCKHVYRRRGPAVFAKFISTFALGLVLANAVVYIARFHVFSGSDTPAVFFVSKAASMVIPFFILYFVRRAWIGEVGGCTAGTAETDGAGAA